MLSNTFPKNSRRHQEALQRTEQAYIGTNDGDGQKEAGPLISYFHDVRPVQVEFLEWLEKVGGKEAVELFKSIQAARALAAWENEVREKKESVITRMGYKLLCSTRRQLKRDFNNFRRVFPKRMRE